MSKANKMVADFRKARNIKKTLGMRAAAGFMRNRGYSVEACVFILLGKV